MSCRTPSISSSEAPPRASNNRAPNLFRIAANLAVDMARKTKVRLRIGGMEGWANNCPCPLSGTFH